VQHRDRAGKSCSVRGASAAPRRRRGDASAALRTTSAAGSGSADVRAAAFAVWALGRHAGIRARLDPRERGIRLAAVLGRAVGEHELGLVVRSAGPLGMGRLSLRPLGLARGVRVVLGTRIRLGSRLGVLALGERLRLLGAAGAARLHLWPRLAWLGGSAARALRATDQTLDLAQCDG